MRSNAKTFERLNAQNICAKIRQYIRKASVSNMLKCCGFLTENCWYQWR